ncbi:MAG: hypothetical protein AAB421_02870 [Patescibacteria group bacterium]
MGDTEILSRNYWGGEFRVPTFRAYAECLDHDPWTVLNEDGRPYKVVPYNETYDGWTEGFKQNKQRSGFMAGALSPYEYAYEYWEKFRMNEYHPDLFQNGTFGVWLALLPQPVSVECQGNTAVISWEGVEPRVHRSEEMGRYTLPNDQRITCCHSTSWRRARAEAYVMAWERMAANEPADRYRAKIWTSMSEDHRRIVTQS